MKALMGSLSAASALADRLRDAQGAEPSPSKVQKLLYIAYAALLGSRGRRLCAEYPRAWTSGPVFVDVFDWTHGHGDVAPRGLHGEVPAEAMEFIDAVVRAFGRHSAQALASALSAPGTPCARTLDGDGFPPLMTPGTKGSFIPDEWTAEWARQKLLRRQAPEEPEGAQPAP